MAQKRTVNQRLARLIVTFWGANATFRGRNVTSSGRNVTFWGRLSRITAAHTDVVARATSLHSPDNFGMSQFPAVRLIVTFWGRDTHRNLWGAVGQRNFNLTRRYDV